MGILKSIVGGGGGKYYTIGLAMLAAIGYLFIAPKLRQAGKGIPANAPQIRPATIPAESGHPATMGLGPVPMSKGMSRDTLRFAGASYADYTDADYMYSDVGISDMYPYRFRLGVA